MPCLKASSASFSCGLHLVVNWGCGSAPVTGEKLQAAAANSSTNLAAEPCIVVVMMEKKRCGRTDCAGLPVVHSLNRHVEYATVS